MQAKYLASLAIVAILGVSSAPAAMAQTKQMDASVEHTDAKAPASESNRKVGGTAEKWFPGCRALARFWGHGLPESKRDPETMRGLSACGASLRTLRFVGPELAPSSRFCIPSEVGESKLTWIILDEIKRNPGKNFNALAIEAFHKEWPCA
jgi:hypothetical protein